MEAEKSVGPVARYAAAAKEGQIMLENAATTTPTPTSAGVETRTFRVRWFILLVICLANVTNAINWICFSPVANLTASFFRVGYGAVNLLSSVFMITAILFGFLSCLLIDLVGIRMSINIGAWLNFVGALIRVFSAFDGLGGSATTASRSARFSVLLVGQIVCSLGQAFLMFVTTKFATSWFAEHQRGLANTLALGSSVLGNLIGALLSPLLVTGAVPQTGTGMNEMSFMLTLFAALSFVPALMACFIRRSLPKLPPSQSSASAAANRYELVQQTSDSQHPQPPRSSSAAAATAVDLRREFKRYLRESSQLMKNRQFVLLFVCFGVGLGIFNAITTLIEQIFCVRGYSNADAGYFAGTLILAGLVGSVVAGVVMDRTKRYEHIAKTCFGAIALLNVLLVVLQVFHNDGGLVYYALLLAFGLLGLFALPLLPVCFESAVECTYPLSESTSTGLLFISGQIFGILLIELEPRLAASVAPDSYVFRSVQTCVHTIGINNATAASGHVHEVLDYKTPMFVQLAALSVVSVAFILFFKCPNLRLKAESRSSPPPPTSEPQQHS